MSSVSQEDEFTEVTYKRKKRKASGSPTLPTLQKTGSSELPPGTPTRPKPAIIKNKIPVILSGIKAEHKNWRKLLGELRQFHPGLKVSQIKELPKGDFLLIGDSMQDVIILQNESKMKAALGIEKAFDNVWHNGLRFKIFQLDLPTKMTRWLSDFLVGRLIQVNANNLLSNQINPKAGVPQGTVLSPLLFLIYVNDLPTPHHKQNSLSQFADDTAQWAFSLNVCIAGKLLQQDLLNLAMWCAKWRIKLNSTKTNVIIFSRSILARKTKLNLKLYGETLKIYPQVKFLGITFDSQLNFIKHFEEILDRCNTRYHRLRLLVNKKWEPSPATLIQIYKQCVRPIFEYGSLSTITASDYIISQIQRLQNKFIRLALRLPKYICTKLLYDSTGLPYVKDRLLSFATKSPDRIAQNPLVRESISSTKLNPAWDRFPTPLSVVRPGQSSV